MKARKLTLGAMTAVAMACAPLAAKADVVQLGFVLDSSGSIGAGNWTTIVNGLSSAVGSLIPVGGTTQYEISVVSFGTGATINVNSFLVDSLAARTALAGTIAALPFLNSGSTNYAAAFDAMTTAMTDATGGTTATATASYVNFATDGFNNAVTNAAAVASRNAMIGAGIDNLSIEAIGVNLDANFLQTQICYPQPCDTTAPYNFPTQGFYIGIADANAYANAIALKIRTVTGQVPEPATLVLAGLALAGIGATRRLKKAA